MYSYLGVDANNKIATLEPDNHSFKETIKGKSPDGCYKYYLQSIFSDNHKSQAIEIDIGPDNIIAHDEL